MTDNHKLNLCYIVKSKNPISLFTRFFVWVLTLSTLSKRMVRKNARKRTLYRDSCLALGFGWRFLGLVRCLEWNTNLFRVGGFEFWGLGVWKSLPVLGSQNIVGLILGDKMEADR